MGDAVGLGAMFALVSGSAMLLYFGAALATAKGRETLPVVGSRPSRAR